MQKVGAQILQDFTKIDILVNNAGVTRDGLAMRMPVEDWDIVIKGQRIAWTGPSGQWSGHARKQVSVKGLWAVPGFGEAHKHIESTMLSPEHEADLVLRYGTTWNVEASHEFSNVNSERNVEFWKIAREHGGRIHARRAVDEGTGTPGRLGRRAPGESLRSRSSAPGRLRHDRVEVTHVDTDMGEPGSVHRPTIGKGGGERRPLS